MTFRQLYKNQCVIAKELNKETTALKILMEELSNFKANELYLYYDEEINNDLLEKIQKAMNQYLYQNIPIQYILGYTYFYGLKFEVDQNVLIPRPETELLVDQVIKFLKLKVNNNFKIIDIGTGSGAIAISIKKNLPNIDMTAIDISTKALCVASKNAKNNDVIIEFIESDLFQNVNNKYDIIVSNPPYIALNEEVEKIVFENEPHLALYANDNGLYFYKKIIKESKNYLNSPYYIIFEIPDNKDEELINYAKLYYPNSDIQIIKDISNRSRILTINN